METLSPGLPNSLFPLSVILEKVVENDITLYDDKLATGFPPSSSIITLSPDFDDLTYGIVDQRDVTYKHVPTVDTTRVVNNSPSYGNFNFTVVSQT